MRYPEELYCERIKELEAENARLQKALEYIGETKPSHCVRCTVMGVVARGALIEGKAEQ